MFLIIFFIIFVVIVVIGLMMLSRFRMRGAIARGLNMSLFSVRVLREFTKEGGQSGEQQQKQEKDIISVAEQMLSSMNNIHGGAGMWKKLIYGEPCIVFEIGVHHIGEEIHFYVATPNAYAELIEKQIHSFYPTAEIKSATDYNIFNPQGISAGAYMSLKKHPVLPFRTYQTLPADPLSDILTAMSKLEKEGEGVALQVLVRPSRNSHLKMVALKILKEMQKGASWGEALRKGGKSFVGEMFQEFNRALNPLEDSTRSKQEEQRQVLPHDQELIKAIAGKVSKPVFDVNIRIIASAPTEAQANEMLRDIGSAFVQFEAPDFNSFHPIVQRGRALEAFTRDYSFRIFNERYALCLSTEEIVSFYHFPLPTTATPRVKFLKAKSAEPPRDMPEKGVILGTNAYRGEERLVRIDGDDRRRHMYMIGQTGTGKSTLLKHMFVQDIAAGNGVAVFDPQGDLIDYALAHIPKERADDVIVFDPSDLERPPGLNFLEIDPKNTTQKTDAIDGFYKILKSVYKDQPEGFGPLFEKYFRYSLMLLLDDYENEVPTIADIGRVFADEEYRNLKLSREKNGDIIRFWKFEATQAQGDWSLSNMSAYITSKFASFLGNDYVRPIITQPKSAFNFREVVDNKKILLIRLPKGTIGELNVNLLGMIILGKLMMATFSRTDLREKMDQAPDFFVYLDEFQDFSTDDLAVILAQGRKYHICMIMAHQFIAQLPDKVREAVFGNVGTMIAFRISPDDAEKIKIQFEPVFSPADIVNIDNFNCYIKLLIKGAPSRPFNMQFGLPLEGNLELAKQITELSRMKYGRDRGEVEQEYLEKQKESTSEI